MEGVSNLEKEAIIFVVVSNSVAAPKHAVLTTDAGTPALPTRSVLMNILDPCTPPAHANSINEPLAYQTPKTDEFLN